MSRLLLALPAVLIATAPMVALAARAPSPDERGALVKGLDKFIAATEDNDAVAIVSALPDRILPSVAKASGMSVPELQAAMIAGAQNMGKASDVKGIKGDLDNFRVDEVASKSGGKLVYGVLHLVGTSVNDGKRGTFDARTLAIFENGHWGFARIDSDQQLQLVRGAYPEIGQLPD